jgi:peptidyl-prolyl cis-trans isomerase SurA
MMLGLGRSRVRWIGYRRAALAIAATALLAAAVSAPGAVRAQQVVALVHGVPITSYDVDQRTRLLRLSLGRAPGRAEVLEELINERIKLREARQWGAEASNAQVEGTFANMARSMGMGPEQFTQVLSAQGINADTLKARIRADLSWGQLVRGRFQASLQIGERDIQSFLDQQQERDQAVAYEYTLRPILFIVPQGSPAAVAEARRREADALRARFQNCDEGIRFARALRDVAVRDPIVRNSADLPAPLRTMLNTLEIGRLTTPETTPQGIELFALCARRETQQGDTPLKRAAREQLFSKRFEEHSKRYLEQIRRRAMIEYR